MLSLSGMRERMVKAQIKRRGVRDRNVLEAMRAPLAARRPAMLTLRR